MSYPTELQPAFARISHLIDGQLSTTPNIDGTFYNIIIPITSDNDIKAAVFVSVHYQKSYKIIGNSLVFDFTQTCAAPGAPPLPTFEFKTSPVQELKMPNIVVGGIYPELAASHFRSMQAAWNNGKVMIATKYPGTLLSPYWRCSTLDPIPNQETADAIQAFIAPYFNK